MKNVITIRGNFQFIKTTSHLWLSVWWGSCGRTQLQFTVLHHGSDRSTFELVTTAANKADHFLLPQSISTAHVDDYCRLTCFPGIPSLLSVHVAHNCQINLNYLLPLYASIQKSFLYRTNTLASQSKLSILCCSSPTVPSLHSSPTARSHSHACAHDWFWAAPLPSTNLLCL